MATISITIPDAVVNRVLDAFGAVFQQDFEDSGLTKAQFAKKKVQDFVREVVVSYEANQAAQAAREIAIEKTKTDIQLN